MTENAGIKVVASVTQEVKELRVKNNELGECSFLEDSLTSPQVIAKMAHLERLSELSEEFWKLPVQKLVFLSDHHFLAKQAALAARSLRRHFLPPRESAASEWEGSEWDNFFDEDFGGEDFCEEDSDEEDWKPRTYPETRFPGIREDRNVLLANPEITILVDAKKLGKGIGTAPDAAELFMPGPLGAFQEAAMFEAARSTLVLADSEIQQREDFVKKLALVEKSDTYVSVLNGQKNEQFLKRLCFEYGFTVIEIAAPTRKHYENVLLQTVRSEMLALGKGVTPSRLIGQLRNYRKADFTEADIATWVTRAKEKHCLGKESLFLDAEDFQLYAGSSRQSGVECLDAMIGLSRLKESVKRLIAVQMAEAAGLCGDKNNKRCLNICFEGRSGVGKTEMARTYAQILGENGVTNGNFLYASRDKFIGKFLGQTAPKIAELFEQGRGGVIFVDEAGTLLSDDIYTKEAITEFVRHMENERETCVIFATYPEEMKQLLAKDPGFSSRISKVITFDEYSMEELWEIFQLMARQKSIETAPECKNAVIDYLSALKSRKKENFGNAREARKLLELSYEFMCLRRGERLTEKDIASAAADVKTAPVICPRMGFFCEDGEGQ